MGKHRTYTQRGLALGFAQAAAEAATDQCILWPYRLTTDGYGRLNVDGKRHRAHRFVLELAVGPAPGPDYEAAHAPLICHTPACVNPAHLRWATRSENMADAALDGTWHAPPVAKGARNGKTKLTAEQVRAIRADARAHQHIAQDFGVCRATVTDIKGRRRWAWLD